MVRLLYNGCERWIDENGFNVAKVISPCGGLFYIDRRSEELNKIYNPHFRIFDVAKMGSAGLEDFATKICSFFPIMESFGGFNLEFLDKFASEYQETSAPSRLIHQEFMREKKIAGVKGIFPTEKLIRSCFGKY